MDTRRRRRKSGMTLLVEETLRNSEENILKAHFASRLEVTIQTQMAQHEQKGPMSESPTPCGSFGNRGPRTKEAGSDTNFTPADNKCSFVDALQSPSF